MVGRTGMREYSPEERSERLSDVFRVRVMQVDEEAEQRVQSESQCLEIIDLCSGAYSPSATTG